LVGTPLARRVAHRFGVLDQPSARKVHRTPTPLLGGLAIYAGFWVSVIAATRLELPTSDIFLPATTLELAAIFLATIPLVVVGFLDDKYKTQGLPPRAKLAAQFLSAGIASAAGLELRVFDTLWLDLPLTCLWVVGITNAINLLDNMDGLSAGATAIAAVSFFTIAAMNGQILVGSLAIALAGACLGFLRYNFHPVHGVPACRDWHETQGHRSGMVEFHRGDRRPCIAHLRHQPGHGLPDLEASGSLPRWQGSHQPPVGETWPAQEPGRPCPVWRKCSRRRPRPRHGPRWCRRGNPLRPAGGRRCPRCRSLPGKGRRLNARIPARPPARASGTMEAP
ncbi:MAG: undecaprenyl/decaprenyl-phosphate alpha-N-acetylglucosaminyl 1-phosphate transferase, partial [Proteobacteria bacterium]|nr:undecaprenyl/decaprenyl-phosphate alpha-N-acetylglucosaminyl 1-phosphate transferase [Pseudomonadota bacterium]